MSFAPIRLDGGGDANVMALSPDRAKMVIGSDTQGFYLSTTTPLGNKWTVQNTGVGKSNFWRQCAAIMWSGTEGSSSVIYAAVGDNSGGGGLLVGTLAGGIITWVLRSGTPQFAGNGSPGGVLPGNGWQRSTGRLLAQDASFLYAATWKDGVLRSSNTGGTGVAGSDNFPVTCNMAGAAPGSKNFYLRSLVLDPVSGNLYAAFYDSAGNPGGVSVCANPHAGTPNFTALSMTSGPTAGVEEMQVVGGYLYAAASNGGVYRYGPLAGSPVWQNLTGSFVDNAASNWWNAVDGYVDGSGNHVIVFGDSNPSTLSKTLVQLTIPSTWPGSGSITYAALTGSVQHTTVPTATGSYTWWTPVAGHSNFLGGAGYITPFVLTDASNLAAVNLYANGSSGFFRSIAGGGWTVANSGMPQFLAHPVAASPTRAGHMVFGDSDWCLFDDTAPGAETATTLVNTAPASSTEGFSVAISADGNTVYAGNGQKYTNANGEVWSRPWNNPAGWVSLGFKAAVGGKVAFGLTAFNDAGGNKIVLAAVWGSGMWRYAPAPGTGIYGWLRVDTNIGVLGSAGNQLPVTYYGAGRCWAYDRKKGVYRSNDYGKTWVQVWAKTSSDLHAGTVAEDPTTPGDVWVSTATGLYLLAGADTGTVAGGSVHPVLNTALPGQAGPVAFDTAGNLHCALQDNGSGSGLVRSPDSGVSWHDIVGDGSFAQCNCGPEFMVISPVDQRIYVSGSNTVATGLAGAAPPPTGSAAFTPVQVSGNLLAVTGVLNLWFSQAGGAPSKLGTFLSARLEITDGTATITAPPGWVLALDVPAAATGGTTRVLIYHYLNNPGGIGSPAMTPMVAAPGLRRAVTLADPGTAVGAVGGRGRLTSQATISGAQIAGGTPRGPDDGLAQFTSSTSVTFKGKLSEFSTPPGTVQVFDQSGQASSASGLASPANFPVTATGPNTFTGGLAIGVFGVNFSAGPTGESWATPGGWTNDGVGNNLTLGFNHVSQVNIGAGPTTVTGQTTWSTGTLGSWAAALATYYAVAISAVTITTPSCPNGTAGTAYSKTIIASGGATPYVFGLVSGTLPAGLGISPGGVLSGTPTTGGAYSFTIGVTDAAAQTATASYTVTISSSVTVTTPSLPAGATGTAYPGATQTAGGGVAPYSWAVTAGSLPPGLAMTAGGVISGTPLAAGVYTFTVQALDAHGAAGTAAQSITVTGISPLTIVTTTLAAGGVGAPYAAALGASGGTAPYSWALTGGSLPPGITLASTGILSGTPTTQGTYSFTATVTDAVLATASLTFTLPVYIRFAVPPAGAKWLFLYGPPQPTGGITAEVLQAQNKLVTLRSEPGQSHEASFDVNGLNPAAAQIDELETDLIVMYGSTIVFDGRIGATQDQLDANGHIVSVTASDYREVLRRRAIFPSDPTPSWAGVEQATIVWNLIQRTQARAGGNLGIVRGVGQNTGVGRTITFAVGDYVADDIDLLAALISGFEWQVNPYGLAADLRLDIFHPNQGANRGVVLELGDGRVSSITRVVDPSTFADSVYVTGDASVSLTAQSLDAADIATRAEGRWDTVVGTSMLTQPSLNDAAAAALAGAQVVTPSYTVVFRPGTWGGPSDIWYGDTVELRIGSGRLQEDNLLRVVEMAFAISPDNVETLTATIGALPFRPRKVIPQIMKRVKRIEIKT